MTFIMDMVGTFIQMEIITLATGLMENGQAGVSQWTNPERFTKECGNTVNLSVIELKNYNGSRVSTNVIQSE